MASELGLGDNVSDGTANAAGMERPESAVNLSQFQREVQRLLNVADDEIEGTVNAVRLLLAIPGAYAAAYFRRADTLRLRPASPLICRNHLADQIRGHESRLVDAIERMVRADGPIVYPLGDAAFNIFVYALGKPGNISGAVALFAAVEPDQVESNPLILAAGLVSAELSQRHLQSKELNQLVQGEITAAANGAVDHQVEPVVAIPDQTSGGGPDEKDAAVAVDPELVRAMATELMESRRDETAQSICHRIANQLECYLDVSQVMLGFADQRQRSCRLQAMSGMAGFAERSPLVTQVEELMAESILHDQLFEARSTDRAHELTSAERAILDLTDADCLVHGPLSDPAGTKIGAWIVIEHPDRALQAERGALATRMQTIQPAVGGTLGLVRRMRRDRLGRLIRRLTLPEDDVSGRKLFWQVAAAIGVLLLVPLPYRVTCDAELFPVMHRFIPAPYEGVLKEVVVEPGDVVTRGQVLARMDAAELEWQIAANKAEYMQASKQHDASLARRDTSASQLAQLEMERLSAETRMLRDREKKLEITSPIDGIILGGDSKQMEGARIRVGENLFETGPLERMVAEVYVADEEIARVTPGQSVRVQAGCFSVSNFSRRDCETESPRQSAPE